MAIINGVGRFGIRSYVATPQQITTSTLLTSLYSVWNGEALGTSLDSSIYGAWNGEHTYNVTTLNNNVYAAWNGENTLNDSLGNYNGTNNGSVTYTTGKTGTNALSFNGSSHISLANDSLKFTGNFTISTWAKVTVGSVNAIVTSGAGTAYGYRLYIGINGRIYFEYTRANGQGEYILGTTVLSSNVWYHIGIVNDGTSFKIYLNGLEESSDGSTYQTIGWGANGTNTAQIGKYAGLAWYLTGALDALTVWNRDLSNSEMNALYNGGAGCQYSFPSSITGTMESTNDAVGTNHGTRPTTTKNSGVFGPSFTTGKIGKAFQFDGINDCIRLPDNSLNSLTGDFSISSWVYLPATYLGTGGATVYILWNVTASTWANNLKGITLRITSNTIVGFTIFDGVTSASVSFNDWSSTYLKNSGWVHITATRKASTGSKLYLNGNLVASNTSTINPVYSPTFQTPNIGNLRTTNSSGTVLINNDFAFNGTKIDALNVWNKELTADEITSLYNQGTGAEYPFSSQTLPSLKNQFAIDNGTSPSGSAPTFTDGKIDKAFTFDGVNDYIALPDNSLNFTGDFSVGMWVYITPSTYTSNSGIQIQSMSCDSWFANPFGWRFMAYGNSVVLQIFNHTNNYYVLTAPYVFAPVTSSPPGWYHILATRKAGTRSRIYINGQLSASDSNTVDPTYNLTVDTIRPTIGNLYMGVNGAKQNSYFAPAGAKVDGVNVWQKELTQAEVTELYNSGNGKQLTVATPIVTNGLVLNLDASRLSSYPNTGTTWYDISGNGNNGNLPGTSAPVFVTASSGIMTFDGINDYVDCGLSNISLPTNITLSAWINQSTLSGYKNIITKEDSTGTGMDYGLTTSPNGNLYFWFHNGSYKIHETSTGVINNTNQWYNVVSVFDDVNNIVKMYVNGVEIYNQSETTSLLAHVNSKLFIGWRNSFLNGQPFYGNISNTQIYNRALSQSEITQNFNATKSRFGL